MAKPSPAPLPNHVHPCQARASPAPQEARTAKGKAPSVSRYRFLKPFLEKTARQLLMGVLVLMHLWAKLDRGNLQFMHGLTFMGAALFYPALL